MQPAQGAGGARRVLRRLRDLMAGSVFGQARLDRVVDIVAGELVAEVCSIYVMRPGEVLELFATKGLKQEAVRNTRLRVGEGLVGQVAAQAQPLALADAQSHPDFAYRPETGEEVYHSLLGVPILRGGRVLGVLVVQNRTYREYAEEEIETVETIAMVLAEFFSGGELLDADAGAALRAPLQPLRLIGMRLTDGVAVGRAVLHRPRVAVRRMVADNPEAELARLEHAVAGMHEALDALLSASDLAQRGEHRDVLEAYRMFAEDRGWLGRIAEAIEAGLTAEAAVQRVGDDTHRRMAQIADPYLRERMADFDDLANRLLSHLTGEGSGAAASLPEDAILIARSLGPAELLDFDRKCLRGAVLEEGSATAHVAIVARALDIPVIGRVKDVLSQVEPLDTVVVDAQSGQVLIRPGDDVRESFVVATGARAQRRAAFAASRGLPAVTCDGVAAELFLNAGLLIDVEQIEPTGAAGIGLFRTEIPFMIRSAFPSVAEQTELYGRILDAAGGKPVVFRTLDIGGDKSLPYFAGQSDENPALGWRAMRIGLDRPALLRRQLRGLLRAAAGRPLSIMFPMVSEVAEYESARQLVEMELDRLDAQGLDRPSPLSLGAMLEVPALVWQLPTLLPRVDFLSVGTNDLFQFLFAADRGNPLLADRYDILAPASLALLRHIAQACDEARVPVTLCGEMGSRPLEAMALLAAGYRRLSMPAAAIGPVKETIRSLTLGPLVSYMQGILGSADRSLREKLRAYARDHGVAV